MSGQREWSIWVRDAALDRAEQIDTYETLEVALRDMRPGGWRLVTNEGHKAEALAQPHASIEVRADNETVMSGPVATVSKTSAGVVEFTGPDDLSWLASRLALPEPVAGDHTAQSHDVRTGLASTVLTEYVRVNVGTQAIVERRVPGFGQGIDPLLGLTVTGRARFQTVLDLCSTVAVIGGVRFDVVGREFRVSEPVNRTASVRISTELGNLVDWTRKQSVAAADYVYVGGGGTLTSRAIAEATDLAAADQPWAREQFYARTDVTDLTELADLGYARLKETLGASGVTWEAIDTDAARWARDYNVGDIVRIDVDGVTLNERVTEVLVQVTPERESITLGSGSVSPTAPIGLVGAVQDTTSRLRDIERG